MTNQLEVVNSPLEALELLEAGNYSKLDVEAFRGFANICTKEDLEEGESGGKVDLEEMFEEEKDEDDCSGNKSEDEQDMEEQDSFKNMEEEATLEDEPIMEGEPVLEDEPFLEEEPIIEDVKENDHPVAEDVEIDQQIEDDEPLAKEEDELVEENGTTENSLNDADEETRTETNTEDDVEERPVDEEGHDVGNEECLPAELDGEIEEPAREEQEDGEANEKALDEDEKEGEAGFENFLEQNEPDLKEGNYVEDEVAALVDEEGEEGGNSEEEDITSGCKTEKMVEMGDDFEKDYLNEGRTENEPPLDLEQNEKDFKCEKGNESSQEREGEKTGDLKEQALDRDEENLGTMEINNLSKNNDLEEKENISSVETTCAPDNEPTNEKRGPILMFSTLGRNDDEYEEEKFTEEVDEVNELDMEVDEEKDEEEKDEDVREVTDEEEEVKALEDDEEELTDEENEVKELEMELEELDFALQKGVESKDISSTLDEIDSIVDTMDKEEKYEEKEKNLLLYDSFEQKLQNIFNSSGASN